MVWPKVIPSSGIYCIKQSYSYTKVLCKKVIWNLANIGQFDHFNLLITLSCFNCGSLVSKNGILFVFKFKTLQKKFNNKNSNFKVSFQIKFFFSSFKVIKLNCKSKYLLQITVIKHLNFLNNNNKSH
jgi:hypothetical protein